MDDWNADLVLHVVQYLNFVDANRLALTAHRYAYLVHHFRRLRGPQMTCHVSELRSLTSRHATTTASMAQQLTQKAVSGDWQSAPPNLALAFSTLSSTLAQDLARYVPSDCVTLGVVSGSIQATVPKLDCRSNAGLMLAHLPQAAMCPFAWAFSDGQSHPNFLISELLRRQQNQQPFKVFMVYACGDEASMAEDFVTQLQAAFPAATIVGGICSGGYCSESTAPYRDKTPQALRHELERLPSTELSEWHRGLGGQLDTASRSWTKAELVQDIVDLIQVRPYRLRFLHHGGVFGVGLQGNVPVQSVVSRGVRSFVTGTTEPSCRYVVHDSAVQAPGDAGYLFGTTVVSNDDDAAAAPPPYHFVQSVRDTETGRILTPQQLRRELLHHQQPDFVGLQRPNGEAGFDLHMPHPLSFNLNAFLFVIDPETCSSPIPSLVGTPLDFFDLTGDACREDMQQTMQYLKEQTTGSQVLGAVMISCSARGPSGSSLLQQPMADAACFARHFEGIPCLGFYAGGEIGPLAVAGGKRHNVFRQGQATLQGFTAVFALFIVPKDPGPPQAIQDDPEHVRRFVQERFGQPVAAEDMEEESA